METVCFSEFCPFMEISWLWYVISVIVVFAVGSLWYGVLFQKQWIKALGFKCSCGADMANGEKCTCSGCNGKMFMVMAVQFVSTALIGLMYFLLVLWSFWIALLVAVAISAWMKAGLMFRTPEWKKFVTLASIDVGYFFLSSLIFILFAII